MGKRVSVELFDDVEPDLAADTERSFIIDGVEYHLDLSRKNAEAFDTDFDKWITPATRVGRAKASQKRSGGKNTFSGGEPGLPLAEIRDWAKANGHEVSDRGRVSAEIVRAWKAATEAKAPAKAPAKKAPAKKAADAQGPNFSDN